MADGVSGPRGRSLERPAFRGPRHPPWFQVVGSRGLGSCHALLCFVAHAGGGGDLLTKPWTWRPTPDPGAPRGWDCRLCLQLSSCRVGGSLGASPEDGRPWCEACSHSWDLALGGGGGWSLSPRPLGCME